MQIGDYTAHVLVDDNELEEHRVEFETQLEQSVGSLPEQER